MDWEKTVKSITKIVYKLELGRMPLMIGIFIFTGVKASNEMIEIFNSITGITLSLNVYYKLVAVGGTVGLFIFGCLLDKLKYAHGIYYEVSSRNPVLTDILKRVKNIEKKIGVKDE